MLKKHPKLKMMISRKKRNPIPNTSLRIHQWRNTLGRIMTTKAGMKMPRTTVDGIKMKSRMMAGHKRISRTHQASQLRTGTK
jgi:hypothetical protein